MPQPVATLSTAPSSTIDSSAPTSRSRQPGGSFQDTLDRAQAPDAKPSDEAPKPARTDKKNGREAAQKSEAPAAPAKDKSATPRPVKSESDQRDKSQTPSDQQGQKPSQKQQQAHSDPNLANAQQIQAVIVQTTAVVGILRRL